MSKIVTDVYMPNIYDTGIPDLHKDATVTDGYQVGFENGGFMQGGKFWTDLDSAWEGNRQLITLEIERHQKELNKLILALQAKKPIKEPPPPPPHAALKMDMNE